MMKPINSIVVVEPNVPVSKDPLSSKFVGTEPNKPLWTPKKDVEIVRIVKATTQNQMDVNIGKLAVVEGTMIKSVSYNGATIYFIESRFIYGFLDETESNKPQMEVKTPYGIFPTSKDLANPPEVFVYNGPLQDQTFTQRDLSLPAC